MTRSDWIALVAAIGTLLGLLPSYRAYFAAKKPRPKSSPKSRQNAEPPSGEAAPEKPMGPYMRAAALTSVAFVLLVIELVAYSWIAAFFKVKVDLNTMPLNWQVGFWSLFAVPGLFCFLALINIVSTMSD